MANGQLGQSWIPNWVGLARSPVGPRLFHRRCHRQHLMATNLEPNPQRHSAGVPGWQTSLLASRDSEDRESGGLEEEIYRMLNSMEFRRGLSSGGKGNRGLQTQLLKAVVQVTGDYHTYCGLRIQSHAMAGFGILAAISCGYIDISLSGYLNHVLQQQWNAITAVDTWDKNMPNWSRRS
ncbi:hypothetical protein BJ508DRAFT_375056 [Ascobolus immersus RN42]|uniref:Uncharacterized protein n=1 Tax=Ascobolus immersus RN42 TaxID=1160509 RepID=A0A3N4IH92_ASCIM|nr:hypothetical protein BJ508DRAFT_375056 [Ascobolus immersus RN42]